ncbi:unnamed protein product [Rotaria socialis]
MTQNYQRKHVQSSRRKSTTFPIFVYEEEQTDTNRRLSVCPNFQRRLSTISQLYLPNGNEYHLQERIPPTGLEYQQNIISTTTTTNENENENETIEGERRLSIITKYSSNNNQTNDVDQYEINNKKFLFIIEPMITGLLLFPILVLFWETGWNLNLIFLNVMNKFSSDLHLDEFTQEDFESYTWQSLFFSYLVVEILLLVLYMLQDFIYNNLKNKNYLIKMLILKFHIFLLSTIYIVQWEMLWTIWDQFTPHEWYFEFTLSLTSLFSLIVFIGHLSDLVCSPFLFSYDSIEFNIQFGCPLLTRQMKQWKINLINFILYEIIISNLSIITWRGFYHFLDNFFYPDNLTLSAGLCLLIGYLLYFPLMYFQTYLEELNLKYDFWTFISINFPQFYRNIRHLLAFLSCVFVWRGYWLLYDEYLYIFEDYYKTYLLFYLISFLFLSLIQTSSSINGPLSNIDDKNQFFPLYPHCYVSIVQRKISQCKIFKQKNQEEITKI